MRLDTFVSGRAFSSSSFRLRIYERIPMLSRWKRLSAVALCVAMLFQTVFAMQTGCCCTRDRTLVSRPGEEARDSELSPSSGRCPKCLAAEGSDSSRHPGLKRPCHCPPAELQPGLAVRESVSRTDVILAFNPASFHRWMKPAPSWQSVPEPLFPSVSGPPLRIQHCSWQI